MLLTANDEGCEKSRETAGTWRRSSPPCDSYSDFTLDDYMPNAWVLCRVGAFPWNATPAPTTPYSNLLNMTKIKGVDFLTLFGHHSYELTGNSLLESYIYPQKKELTQEGWWLLGIACAWRPWSPQKRGFWGPQWSTTTHEPTIHWTSTELIFGLTLVTNSVGNRSHA